MAFVRLFKELLKDPEIGKRFVPIIPDEARTFGMDAMFPIQKIYNPAGQLYQSVDRELFLSYKEAVDGQILHEGINEAGSAASFQAAGSSYSTHDEPMIPVYIFYSMFGFQRTADQFWACMDQKVRGFLLGATAGRTTLNGEGLQHEDGHSHLHRLDQPGGGGLRPGVRLRDRAHRQGRVAPDVRRGFRGHLLLPDCLQRADRAARRAGERRRRGHPQGDAPVVARRGRRSPGATAGLRGRRAVGGQGTGVTAQRLGRRGRRVVGDLLERTAPGRAGGAAGRAARSRGCSPGSRT